MAAFKNTSTKYYVDRFLAYKTKYEAYLNKGDNADDTVGDKADDKAVDRYSNFPQTITNKLAYYRELALMRSEPDDEVAHDRAQYLRAGYWQPEEQDKSNQFNQFSRRESRQNCGTIVGTIVGKKRGICDALGEDAWRRIE